MSIRINDFASPATALLALNKATGLTQRSLSRLSSGSRLVATADDAAGLAVSSKLAASIRRADAVSANLKNADSFLRAQDSALDAIGKGISRMMELKTLSLDATKNLSDIANYEAEFAQVRQSIITISSLKFNGIDLFSHTGQDTYLDARSDENGQQSIQLTQFAITAGKNTWISKVSNFSFVESTLPWNQAKADAESKGGHLLTVTSAEKWANVLAEANPDFSKTIWIGAFQQPGSVEPDGGWSWVTGEPFDYSRWHTPAPNEDGGGQNEDVVRIESVYHPIGGADNINDWNDMPRSYTAQSYILETPVAVNLATTTVDRLQDSLQYIATCRATNGATQFAVGIAVDNSQTRSINMEAAKGKIADVDVATETQSLAKAQILAQISAQMVKQSSDSRQIILQLIEKQQSSGA
jgi:flagellin-like hook-associated protein FlgL